MKSLPDSTSDDVVLWIDAQDLSQEEINDLKKHFDLNEMNLEEVIKEGQRSRIEENQDRTICFLSFPKKEGFVSKGTSEWLAIIAEKRWIITFHKGHSDITRAVRGKIANHGYFALSPWPSTDVLLYVFLDLIANEYFLVSDLLHERLQNLSKQAGRLFRERSKVPTAVFSVEMAKSRDQVLELRQSIGPLREIVGRIARGEFMLVSNDILPKFEDLYDRTISLIEIVDNHREEIHDIGDILINFQTITTNNIVRLLTIISAIFLPLTLIAGIYGTNFGRGFSIPGSNITYGFYLMIAVMVGLALSLIAIFRRKGWL